jgi:hypothetical protein
VPGTETLVEAVEGRPRAMWCSRRKLCVGCSSISHSCLWLCAHLVYWRVPTYQVTLGPSVASGNVMIPQPPPRTATTGGSGRAFTLLIFVLRLLVTSSPAMFGISTGMQGFSLPANDMLLHSSCHNLASVAGTVATAANATD